MPLVWLLVPERPASIGMVRYGAEADDVPPVPPASQGNFLAHTLNTLRRAAGTRVFWYLFATFFVCGFTTNGLVGTHLIAFCGDMGIGEVQAAGLLSMMGIFDLIGTTLSGWLTDRFDPRKLLGVYYAHSRPVADLSALFRLLGDQPDHLRRALRSRLDRHRAADAAGSPTKRSATAAGRSSSAGSSPAIRSGRPPPPSSAAPCANCRAITNWPS